ncbi:hypothetical protein Terro_0336 [Terriglobus roseus DSM 18391]|uniref:Uncharacterized protein n=1 Tax=Terriglobus roseus (strain DSM 18391 / NRRL B-41598 / KBS 63) TaxID=926566 RepID=I3ZBR7_TERRK|nr:hypothetical protein [Terriglobus roseus]AFL86685.1 hypothetical protein Terro_0336 [Terriglobus roseus DSM 18391]
MSTFHFILSLSWLEIALGLVVLTLLIREKAVSTFWPVLVLSLWQIPPTFTLFLLQRYRYFTAQHAYAIYYFLYWILFALEAAAAIALTYTILHNAMRPLKGLQSLGRVVYLWAAAISVVIALQGGFQPNKDVYKLVQFLVLQLQRASGIITVSLVLFVGVAIRPMGLSLRSRIFGTGIGLFVLSLINTLQSNYFMEQKTLYGRYGVIHTVTNCVVELIWIYYFAVPEPQRKFILLPTTSPFHRWNQISELLGQDPGYVAIGGIPPEAFAAAEIEVFHRASAKMNALGEANEPPKPERLEK